MVISVFFSEDPQQIEYKNGIIKSFYTHWFNDQSAPTEIWQPYYIYLFAQIKAAQEANPQLNVALSHSVYVREGRDFIRANLPNVTYLFLTVPQDELIRRHKQRFAKFAEGIKLSIEEAFKLAYQADYSEELYLAKTTETFRGIQPLAEDEKNCHQLQSNTETYFSELNKLLGLPPPVSVDVAAIQQINYDRFNNLKKEDTASYTS